jgi:DNA-nicking Smr family endonuclease
MKEAPPPRPQRLRRLSDEEIALWTEVARTVARRRGATLPTPSKSAAARASAAPPVSAEPPLGRPAKPSAPPLAPIERRLKREIARGRAAIDAVLDLHGLTQAEAHQALRGFLRQSQARGARLVIIVTGKGGALEAPGQQPHERGVLRRLTPHWLREPDLRPVVLGFEEAGRAHGGSGALYVRLRRLNIPAGRP